MTGKMRKAPIKGLDKPVPKTEEIHHDLSGPLKQSFNRNKFAVDLMDSRTAFSEAHAVPTKGHVLTSVQGFIS